MHVTNDTERGQGDRGANFRKYSNEQMEERMLEAETSGHVRYQYPVPTSEPASNGVKIFGLVAVRNVEENIGLFLKLLVRSIKSTKTSNTNKTNNFFSTFFSF